MNLCTQNTTGLDFQVGRAGFHSCQALLITGSFPAGGGCGGGRQEWCWLKQACPWLMGAPFQHPGMGCRSTVEPRTLCCCPPRSAPCFLVALLPYSLMGAQQAQEVPFPLAQPRSCAELWTGWGTCLWQLGTGIKRWEGCCWTESVREPQPKVTFKR